MRRREFIGKATVGAVGVGALGACGGEESGLVSTAEAAVQGPEVQWRLATSFPPSLDILHGTADYIADRVSALTGGRFQMRVYAAGELVPALQVMDAVQQGTIQAGVSAGYYYVGKNPALAFDSGVPFGLTSRQRMAWVYSGGGLELIQGVYSDFGITAFPAGNTGMQMGGWFRDPIEGLSDLRGLRIRIPGIGGEILTRMGASVQVLGGPDIYPALERGAIDATEWVGPYDDEKLGFYQITPNYYMPGWWEPGVNLTLQISTEAFNELPPSYQELLRTVSREATANMLARYDVENPKALGRLVNEHGVTLRTFSDEILQSAWTESNAYLAELAGGDAQFRGVYDSWKAFRDTAFPYSNGNEQAYARFAFGQLPSPWQMPTG